MYSIIKIMEIKMSKQWNAKRRAINRQFIKDMRAQIPNCWICQQPFEHAKEPLYHHIEPKQKRTSVNRLVQDCFSLQTIKLEMLKTMPVCYKCHSHIHKIYNEKEPAIKKEDITTIKNMFFYEARQLWKKIFPKMDMPKLQILL